MTDDVRHSAIGMKYAPADNFSEFVESDFGHFIEGFLYTIDKDGILTIMARNGKFIVRPNQMVYVYDEDNVMVKDSVS